MSTLKVPGAQLSYEQATEALHLTNLVVDREAMESVNSATRKAEKAPKERQSRCKAIPFHLMVHGRE